MDEPFWIIHTLEWSYIVLRYAPMVADLGVFKVAKVPTNCYEYLIPFSSSFVTYFLFLSYFLIFSQSRFKFWMAQTKRDSFYPLDCCLNLVFLKDTHKRLKNKQKLCNWYRKQNYLIRLDENKIDLITR